MSDAAPPAADAAPPKPPNNLVGLGLLAAFLALGAALALDLPGKSPVTFGFVMTGWVLAVMAHEFAHAWVAYRAGDWTVKAKGYLGFDPRRYADLGTSLVIPVLALALGGIGFPGGAVYLRNDLMRSRGWRAAASLAGPAATLAVLLLLALVLDLWARAALPNGLFAALAMLAFLQATALLLNLLPIPGLDGFNAIRPFLPAGAARTVAKYEGLAMLALLGVLLTVPAAGGFLFGGAGLIAALLGVPPAAMADGWDAFHFWR
jgi:Zn-dependent protease